MIGPGHTELTPEFQAISKLEIMESFEFPQTRCNRIVAAITKQKHANPQRKYTTRKVNELFSRVWRIK